MDAIAESLLRDHPDEYRMLSISAPTLREAMIGPQRETLGLLLGGVALLLLIACANTAQLLLARSLRRNREVCIRLSLGASRRELVRQFLIEGLILALCGVVLGLISSQWLVKIIIDLLPVHNPMFESAHLDSRVVWFTLVASVVSAVVFSIVPAMKG